MNWKAGLRTEIARRARERSISTGAPYYESLGSPPTILFQPYADRSRHGNFIDESYIAIINNKCWADRLMKPHPRKATLPEKHRDEAKELDSSNSSDALLMNVFCYPKKAISELFRVLLPEHNIGEPKFGTDGLVPRVELPPDSTEIDMRVGNVIFEAKLTEDNFKSKRKAVLDGYKDFRAVFEIELVPQTGDCYHGYQLIRNVLAAHAHDYYFTVICDARRPDLLREWWQVHAAIRPSDLRNRCSFLLWQEIARVSPRQLHEFLQSKYGL